MSSNNEGLLCPECMKEFSDVGLLTSHFEGSHNNKGSNKSSAKEPIQSETNEPRIVSQQIQSAVIEVDPKKMSPPTNEQKMKPMNKFAVSLGDFITNFSLKPTAAPAPETDVSSRTSIPRESQNKNDEPDARIKIKDHRNKVLEQNQFLSNVLNEFYRAGQNQNMDELQQLVEKYKDTFDALNQAEPLTTGKIGTAFPQKDVYQTKLEAVSLELENSKQQIKTLQNEHKTQLEALKANYDLTIAKLSENNDSNEDEVKSKNAQLLQETLDMKEKLLLLETQSEKLLEKKLSLETELIEMKKQITSLNTNHSEETAKLKSKMQRLVEAGVKAKNDKTEMTSQIEALKKSLAEFELHKTKLTEDNEEILKNLLEKNEKILAQNKALSQTTKKLTDQNKQHQDQYNKLLDLNKKLGDKYTEAQKTIESLQSSKTEDIASLESIKLKLEKEIISNGKANKKIIEFEQKIKQLNEVISGKDIKYNELVSATEKEAHNFRSEAMTTLNRVRQAEANLQEQLSRYEVLKSQNDQSTIQNQQDQTKIKELDDKISQLTHQLSTHDDYVNGLLDKISIHESQAVYLEHKYREGNLALCELDEENRKFKVKLCEIYSRNWKNDASATGCLRCESDFNFTKRKHHCRNCGNIFCEKCCSTTVSLPCSSNPERVCDSCAEEIKYFRNQL